MLFVACHQTGWCLFSPAQTSTINSAARSETCKCWSRVIRADVTRHATQSDLFFKTEKFTKCKQSYHAVEPKPIMNICSISNKSPNRSVLLFPKYFINIASNNVYNTHRHISTTLSEQWHNSFPPYLSSAATSRLTSLGAVSRNIFYSCSAHAVKMSFRTL